MLTYLRGVVTKYKMVPFKKIFSLSTLTLLVALTLSAIAAWYSIQGLMAIFAAAVIPIVIMGGSLEVAKVVTTVWLHRYWDRASIMLRLYLVPAVIALALLTSMGIFGFLSKAHSDQGLVSGDVQAKIAIYDEKIKTERDNIEAAKNALKQMDAQVDQMLGRTDNDKGAERAVQIRRQQAKERTALQKEISDAQTKITKLNEERAPIAAENRKVEAEVGPIKYIAALIYGDNPDANLLERAVRWVIILIVFVFDPLALTLVIASTTSYKWIDEDEKPEEVKEEAQEPAIVEEEAEEEEVEEPSPSDDDLGVCYKCGTPLVNAPGIGPFCPNKECDVVDGPFEDNEPLVITIDPELLKPQPIERVEDENDVPNDVAEPNDVVGESVHEAPVPDASEQHSELEQTEVAVDTKPQPESKPVEIQTEGVTYNETDGGYVQFEGKSMTKHALQEMRPDIFRLTADSNGVSVNTNFGTQFPKLARKGDIFVRVDLLPNRVYKFDSTKWIEINKAQSDSYLYDEAYIQHLISKIDSGEYDVELLSENEKAQIESYLSNQKT